MFELLKYISQVKNIKLMENANGLTRKLLVRAEEHRQGYIAREKMYNFYKEV